MPRLLAFDTSTEHLSVAVRHGERVFTHSGAGGAQASGTLIPLILQVLAEAGLQLAALDAIAFGRGPGSFTGLRTACSVAQGLAFGAGVPLLPVDTLLTVAEEARHAFGARQVVAALDARMDQLYAARYDFDAGGALLSNLPPLHSPLPPLPDRVADGETIVAPTSRNAPCPCGSGLKYKHCHGQAA